MAYVARTLPRGYCKCKNHVLRVQRPVIPVVKETRNVANVGGPANEAGEWIDRAYMRSKQDVQSVVDPPGKATTIKRYAMLNIKLVCSGLQ